MSFSLNGEDYEKACDAIKNHLNVYVKGVFKRKNENENIKYSLIKLEKKSVLRQITQTTVVYVQDLLMRLILISTKNQKYKLIIVVTVPKEDLNE